MTPEIRWPYFWDVLNIVVMNYEVDKQERYKMFFGVLPLMLPCQECSQHCMEYFMDNQPNLNSQEELKEWLLKFHNFVNKRNDKPEWDMEMFDEYCKKFANE